MPTADQITVLQTLALLDADYKEVAQGVARQEYALWLGSGISLDRIVGVKAVIERVLEYLRTNATIGDANCRFNHALEAALACLTHTERAGINLTQSVHEWATRDDVLNKLAGRYSNVLDIRLPNEPEDFLLWIGVDVPNTFRAEEPDVEHICVVLLAIEGAITNVPSGNWDFLIEAAEARLTAGSAGVFDVCIRSQDFQASGKPARLMKFHGCAALAIDDPTNYRKLLVARESQIASWSTNNNYAAMRQNLLQIALSRRTLMIGLSAQDRDIQDLFVHAQRDAPWGWPNTPTPHVFAEEKLSDGQKLILKCVYKDEYQQHQVDIEKTARLPAYGKPLLLALFLRVLELKIVELANLAVAHSWPGPDRLAIADGIRHLRDRIADAAEPNRLAFVRNVVAAFTRGQRLYHEGRSEISPQTYQALTIGPLQQVSAVPASAGLRQAALVLSILGIEERAGAWIVSEGNPALHEGAPVLVASGGRTTRLFFVANDDIATRLVLDGVVDEGDSSVVIALSSSPARRRRRSPVDAPGRDGRSQLCEISLSGILHETTTAADFTLRLKQEATF